MTWKPRNQPTAFEHIERTDDGRYAVRIQRPRSRYYKNGFASLAEAVKSRNETLARMAEKDNSMQAETYGALIPANEQCEKCSRPHLPGSRYCELHKKKTRS